MSQTREEWLNALASRIAESLGVRVPVIRLSVGLPSRRRSTRVGEGWAGEASADGSSAIFISPIIADAAQAAHVLCHEMIHAAVGVEHGHRGPFRRMALRIGLTGKMTATTASAELAA